LTSKLYLGIDVSTSCTGFALIDETGKLIEASFVYLDSPDHHQRALDVKKEIERYSTRGIERVSIEANLTGFQRGRSSAHVLMTLARFNGVVTYLAREVLSITPDVISVTIARNNLGIKIPRGSDPKAIVKMWVDSQEKDYTWQTKVLKSGPRKGETVLEKGVEDAMDAYVIARAVLLLKNKPDLFTINHDRRRRKTDATEKSPGRLRSSKRRG
jgi:hypothetical protein